MTSLRSIIPYNYVRIVIALRMFPVAIRGPTKTDQSKKIGLLKSAGSMGMPGKKLRQTSRRA